MLSWMSGWRKLCPHRESSAASSPAATAGSRASISCSASSWAACSSRSRSASWPATDARVRIEAGVIRQPPHPAGDHVADPAGHIQIDDIRRRSGRGRGSHSRGGAPAQEAEDVAARPVVQRRRYPRDPRAAPRVPPTTVSTSSGASGTTASRSAPRNVSSSPSVVSSALDGSVSRNVATMSHRSAAAGHRRPGPAARATPGRLRAGRR